MLKGLRGFSHQLLKQLWQTTLLIRKTRNVAPILKLADALVQFGRLMAKRYPVAVIPHLVVELSHMCTHIRRLFMVAHFHTGYVKCDISKETALRRTFILYRRHCKSAVALKFIDDARQAKSITSHRCIAGHALTQRRIGNRRY